MDLLPAVGAAFDDEVVGYVGKSLASLNLPAGKGPYKASVAVHLNRR